MTNCLAKKDLDSCNLDKFSEDRKKEVLAIKDSIVFNSAATLAFAGSASKSLTDFSSDLLRSVKLKDTPEVEGLVSDLLTGLSKVDATTLQEIRPTLFKRLFRVDEVKQFITRYEDVESIIDSVKEKLESASFQLLKDVELCDRYLEQNIEYINALDNFIVAGNLRLKEELDDIEAAKTTLDTDDQLAVYALNARQDEADRFSRKLHDLMLMRAIAIQNIPQITLIKQGDSVLIEKIDSSINSAIPLWESQMVIAIQLMRQRGALAIDKAVTSTTNRLIEKNGELLKAGTIDVAKALETGIVDLDVLKKNNQMLIETLTEVKKIREDGRNARLKAAQEIGMLQSKLNEQLLLISGT